MVNQSRAQKESEMTLLAILLMTVIVFLSRYLFLEPRVPLKLNHHAQRLLSYSGSVVLTALWAPIVFLPEGEFSLKFNNPYLIGAILTALLMWKTKNILLTTILSMAVFLFLKLVVFN
jgi:branched-subunit amino acid transport protein